MPAIRRSALLEINQYPLTGLPVSILITFTRAPPTNYHSSWFQSLGSKC